MNKRLIILLSIIIFLVIVSSGAYASGLLSELFAIGSSGVAKLDSDEAYALTSMGLQKVTSAEWEDMGPGSSGLLYTDGKISVKSNTVKVGLNFYYAAGRDTGLEEARLENDVGTGFAFGYFDDDREFVELSRTGEPRLTLRIKSGNGIAVYATDTNQLLYDIGYTDSRTFLGVMPLCEDDEGAVTWFAKKKYYGGFEYAVLGGDKISVINVVDIEKYVMGVCASEMNESWPLEALKAQAVAARTYVQNSIMTTTYYTRCGFDVTNDTYCQAYSGCTYVGENIIKAVNSTKNQYITYEGEYINAMYFSSDGGATEDMLNVNGSNTPYLRGIEDPYEAMTDSFNSMSTWQTVFTPTQLAEKLDLEGEITSITPSFSKMGNVIKIEFVSSSGQSVSLLRGSCRTGLGLNSIRYTVSIDGDGNFVFDGKGWGHHLGMSQYGAYSMARYYDKSYKDILGFYYYGVGLSDGVN